jgi:predicted AlkP superfamily phosphohydrolase/phosphomutase
LRERYRDELKRLYIKMDELVGRTIERLGDDPDTVLLVMSDHGFKPFRRGVNLNTWLWKEGLLALKDGQPTGADMLADVDWTRTKAYAVGFGGIYLNLKGREARGIVQPGEEAEAVKQQIRAGLLDLADPADGRRCVGEVYDTSQVYRGPYAADAPDLIAGFTPPYRVGWSSVTGGVAEQVFEDNTRPWSGDHNFNPPDVPGILFSSRPLEGGQAHIMDIGPTVLDLFGVQTPAWCDGRSLMPGTTTETR